MSTIDELKTLEEALDIVRSNLLINREVMTDGEVKSTVDTIRNLNAMISSRKHDEYLKQLNDFKRHMDATLEEYHTDDESNNDAFYRMDFEVTFNCKTVVLENGADVFNDIYRCIEDEITEQTC